MEEKDKFFRLRHEMVHYQIINRNIKDNNVIRAMEKIPRHLFVDEVYQNEAYSDYPVPIGSGQTISQPYIVALMTQELSLLKSDKVLEIGTGSGYQTAILAEIANEVFTVEKLPELMEKAKKVLLMLNYKNIYFRNSDGYNGWPEKSPFDKIIVTAAPGYIPDSFINQLKDTGIMVIPVGLTGFNQKLFKITKLKNKILKDEICDVAFVPLIKEKNK
jgi:protein-L-isoaspartate(D-aspartate) O-methyltransferase